MKKTNKCKVCSRRFRIYDGEHDPFEDIYCFSCLTTSKYIAMCLDVSSIYQLQKGYKKVSVDRENIDEMLYLIKRNFLNKND